MDLVEVRMKEEHRGTHSTGNRGELQVRRLIADRAHSDRCHTRLMMHQHRLMTCGKHILNICSTHIRAERYDGIVTVEVCEPVD